MQGSQSILVFNVRLTALGVYDAKRGDVKHGAPMSDGTTSSIDCGGPLGLRRFFSSFRYLLGSYVIPKVVGGARIVFFRR
jgi:hypothetical protein